MKLRKLILLNIYMLLAFFAGAQEPVYVGGQVTATETGMPIAQKEVSAGLVTGQAMFTDYTDENGFYIIIIPPAIFDTATLLHAWVSDCNQQIHFHPFVANPNIAFDLDFEICTQNSGCQSSFIYRTDTANSRIVYFENLSSPVTNTTNWAWDFGDGTVSTEQNPVHEFLSSGIYNVCLYMSDSVAGCSSLFCLEVWIDSNPVECLAMFSYYNEGLTSAFVDQSLGFPDTWFWDFGDGTSSNEPNPVHTWAYPGTYPVCLHIMNSVTQCQHNFCEWVTVGDTLQDCQAMFNWIPQGLTVSFSDLSTGNPDTWLWVFEDGTTSSLANPVHSYAFPGTYPVCLSIYNSLTQCESNYCDFITIGDTLPSCDANYIYQAMGGNTLAFTNLSTGYIDQVIWDFGDGSPFSYETNPVYTWQQPGIYQVCLVVISNFSGCDDVLCMDITVGDTISACQAAFSALADSIPGNINHYWFVDESTGSNISSWYWDFGDGTISFVQHPEYTFAESGTYEVCLTVSGEGNGGYCSSTTCKTISTPSYFNLGGQIFAGNFPINNPDFTGDTAQVTLFRKTGELLSEVSSGVYYDYGYYFFVGVMEGNYVVHAELTPGSASYQSYLPAYSGQTPHWQQSQYISLNTSDFFEANIEMPALSGVSPGPGTITGNIDCLENVFVGLSGRIVFLKQSGNIIAYTNTGENGDFIFTNLALGNYSISAEIAGMFSQTLEINLTEYGNQALNNLLLVSSSYFIGIDDNPGVLFPEVTVYPNPAAEKMSLRFSLAHPANITTVVYNASGSACIINAHQCNEGDAHLTINTAYLSQGIYLLVLKSEEGQVLKSIKFAKR